MNYFLSRIKNFIFGSIYNIFIITMAVTDQADSGTNYVNSGNELANSGTELTNRPIVVLSMPIDQYWY